MKEYYTYAYLREDRSPYYIGKGKGYRAFSKHCRSCSVPERNRILFLKKNLTEEEAFKHEIYMISVFGRKDLGTGILRNLTDGGDGSSGTIITEKTRENFRQRWKIKNHPMLNKHHSIETKERMSIAKQGVFDGQKNPMYGRIHSEKTIDLMSSKAKIRTNEKYCNYYEFISPTGEKILEFTTIIDFCKKYNLRADCMRRVMLGQRKSHKGWTGRKIDGKTTN